MTRMIRRMVDACLVTALAACLAPAAAAQNDTVRTKDGQAHSGRIKAEDYAQVVIDVQKKGAVSLPWDTVEAIEYTGGEEVAAGAAALASGDYAAAAEKLRAVVDDKKTRAVLKQRAMQQLAAALFRGGNPDEAAAVCEALQKEFPTGRYAAASTRLLVDIARSKGDLDGALKTVERISSGAKGAGLPDSFRAEAGIIGAEVREAKGEVDKALADYQAASAVAGIPASIKAEADVGVARCHQLAGRADEAEKGFRAVVQQDVASRILCAGWNGIGDVLLDKGRKARSVDALLDAVTAYLRGCVQYVPAPGESSTQQERAFEGAAKCFQFLADLEAQEDTKKLYRQRSNERWHELRRLYPNSPFLKDAPSAGG